MTADRANLLEEEVIIVRHSGEIPEIALHTSLYYLEEDDEGPRLSLAEEELTLLYDAAITRAQEIVLRDLQPENRDLSIYRGLARSYVNWQRFRNLCRRIGRRSPGFREEVATALVAFLRTEVEDVRARQRKSSVNCSVTELTAYCGELALDPEALPDDWQSLCCRKAHMTT